MPQDVRSNEIRILRLYDAPRGVVWDAFTNPARAALWWGPRGFTITTHAKELRPGGVWHYTMHGPDGVDYPNKAKYLEVEPAAKLVYDHGGNDERAPLFRVTVTFTEVEGKTRMDMRMSLPTPEAAEETRKFIKKAGGDATWDRLAEYLQQTTSGTDCFVINRSFATPIANMFEMWTDAKRLAEWLAPTGFQMRFMKSDIRPGGSSFYLMTNGSSVNMYGRVSYLKLERPRRIVYTQQFCDEQERVTRHPMSPTWPETMRTSVHFTEEGPDQTRVTVKWEPHGATTREELDTFIQARAGMTQGWTGSFDQLEACLAR